MERRIGEEKRAGKSGERVERGGGWRFAWAPEPVCFRSVLKDYPFISTHTLVSVVTQREVSRALSCRDLQRHYEETHCSRAQVFKWSD